MKLFQVNRVKLNERVVLFKNGLPVRVLAPGPWSTRRCPSSAMTWWR
jgi:hypothetical protein